MAIIVSCPQEVKLFMLGALFCGCSACAASGEGELGLINNYALSRPCPLASPLPLLPSHPVFVVLLSLSHAVPVLSLSLSPPLFLHRSRRSDIKANLRRRSQTHRAGVARAKPGRVKIKSELICHERAPSLCLFIPRGLCAGLARARQLDRTARLARR